MQILTIAGEVQPHLSLCGFTIRIGEFADKHPGILSLAEILGDVGGDTA
jgi:hypothetical protein